MMPSRLKPRVPTQPSTLEPIIEPTGNETIDAMGGVLNSRIDAFRTAPPPEQGTLGVISHSVNACLGVVAAPFELLDTGFAAATSGIAKLVPGMPAATLATKPMLGSGHAHPIPAIPPRPPVSPVTGGPIAAAGCVSVIIGGIPAARASDVGLGVGCLGVTPIFEVYTGSSNVFFGGSRAARMGDITRQCNPASAMGAFGKAMGAAGVAAGGLSAAASASGGGAAAAAMQAAQAAADAAALAMAALLGKDPGGPPGSGMLAIGDFKVLVGGFPMPDTITALGGLVKGALTLAKGIAKIAGKFANLRKQSSLDPSEPVSVVTGAVWGQWEDAAIVDDVPFLWARHYDSRHDDASGPLGRGFRHFYEKSIVLHRRRAVFLDYDGVELEFQREQGRPIAATSFGYRLIQPADDHLELTCPGGERMLFVRAASGAALFRLARLDGPRYRGVQLGYDGRGRLLTLTQPREGDWIDTRFLYDRDGRLLAVGRGQRGQAPRTLVEYRYRSGRLVEVVIEGRTVLQHDYDRVGRMIRNQDASGYGFSYAYDNLGRCIRARGDDGLWGARLEYQVGRTIVTEEDNGVWVYDYDDAGIVRRIEDPCGGAREFRVDERGRISHELDALGRVTTWLYDATDHNYGRRDPAGELLAPLDRDPRVSVARRHRVAAEPRTQQLGQLPGTAGEIGVPDAAAGLFPRRVRRPIVHAHDRRGRIVASTDAEGRTEVFAYDANGQRVGHTDADGRERRWIRRSGKLVAARSEPGGATTRFEHGHRENVTRIEDPGGHVTSYRYDRAGRVVEVRSAGELDESYVYDVGGRLLEKRDANGDVLIADAYSDDGRMRRRRLASGDEHVLVRDGRGRYIEASAAGFVVELAHAADGSVIRDFRDGRGVEVRAEGRALVVFDRFRIDSAAGPHGERVVVLPDGSSCHLRADASGRVLRKYSGGVVELSRFDSHGRCAARYAWIGDASARALRWAHYERTPAGQLRTVRDTALGSIGYTHDAAGRVIGEQRDGEMREESTYDVAGNITRIGGSAWLRYDERNRLIGGPEDGFVHDHRGRMAEHHRADGRSRRFSYDALDRLIAIESDSAPPWRAAYDALGRRIYKQSGEARTWYVWHGDRIAAEATDGGSLRIYVYADATALVPISFVDYDSVDADPSVGRVHHVLGDHLGMPVLIVDACGRVVWRARRIAAFGQLEVADDASIEYDLRWPGHLLDRETGLHYNRFRYYDPAIGRYLQPDPAGQAGGVNLYAYPGNPLAMVDVLGLCHDRPGQEPNTGDESGPDTRQPANGDDAQPPPPPPAPQRRKGRYEDKLEHRVGPKGEPYTYMELLDANEMIDTIKRENPALGELAAKERDPNLTHDQVRQIITDLKPQLAEKGITLKVVGEDVAPGDVPESCRPEPGNAGRFDGATDTIYYDPQVFQAHPNPAETTPAHALREIRHEIGAIAIARETGGKDNIPVTGPNWATTHILDGR